MIKKIKHIINFCAVISLLAISFLGCKQPTAPELEQKPITPPPTKYTVTFQTEVGQAPEALKVDPDYELTADNLKTLYDETKQFKGWYEGSTEVKAGYKVTKDVTLTAKWEEKVLSVTSLEFDKSIYYRSDEISNETEIKATVKGTGFSLLKKDPKQNIRIAIYKMENGVISSAPVFTTDPTTSPAEIDYLTDTATITFKITDIPAGTESGPAVNKVEYKGKVVLNDKTTEVANTLFVKANRPYITNTSDLYCNLNNGYYLSPTDSVRLSELTGQDDFDFDFEGNYIDSAEIIIKLFNENGVQEGADIEFTENLDSTYNELYFSFPQKLGTYTVKLFFDGIEQKYYYDVDNNPNPLTSYTVSIVDPVITSVSIPNIDINNTSTIPAVMIKGNNFISDDTNNFTFKCDKTQITGNFIYINKETFKLIFEQLPTENGEYPITINFQDQSITKNLIIKDFPPAEVTNFTAIIQNDKTILSWSKPIESDFEKVIITYDSEKIEIPKGTVKTEINSASPKDYTIKTVDTAGNTSTGVTIKSIIFDNITDRPKAAGTVNIDSNPYDIIEFGQWPQTVKEEGVSIDETQATKINGWDCYLGSDNCYYTKTKAYTRNGTSFDNGNSITENEIYFFKIEPIKWRVITKDYNNSGKKLLLAEKALMTGMFDKNFNNYQDSEIRARLNGLDKDVTSPNGDGENRNYKDCGFLQKAFSKEAIGLIANTTLTDSNNVQDKIFLVSQEDMKNSTFGFSTADSRKRLNTDYVRATGGWEDSGNRNGWWWTRSNYTSNTENAIRIQNNGTPYEYTKEDAATSIVPALCLN